MCSLTYRTSTSKHTVWVSNYQTVTDSYPVTQTALGRCLVGGMVQPKVSALVYSEQDGHGSAPPSQNAGTLSHHILVLNAVLHGCLGVN